MTAIEQRQLKGFTIKNLVLTVTSTASIVISVMTSYFNLKNDIHDVRTTQETQARVNEIRLKVLEGNVAILRQQVDALMHKQTPKS